MHSRPNDNRHRREPRLTPEEDSISDPGDIDDEIDDLLPADLWFVLFVSRRQLRPGLKTSG